VSGLIVSGAAAGRTGVTDTHEEGLKAGVAAAQLVELGVDAGPDAHLALRELRLLPVDLCNGPESAWSLRARTCAVETTHDVIDDLAEVLEGERVERVEQLRALRRQAHVK